MKEYTYLVNDLFSYRTPYELLIAKRYPGASFAVFDVHSLMTDMYNNPTEYFASPANVTGQYYLCPALGGSCGTTSTLSLDHFMWYDELHPSEQSDKAIAKEFVKVVQGSSKYAAYW
jgi:phospholipase/lecithinase/hemolysin